MSILLLVFVALKFKDYSSPKIEIIEPTSTPLAAKTNNIVVEIAGSVEKPGVYTLEQGARIADLLTMSGGFTKEADLQYIDKSLNKAAKLVDSQKIYIPAKNEQSNILSANKTVVESEMISINDASATELDSLSGIGPVYAQKIIEHRPYSDVNELVSKKIIPQSVYTKIKDKISL